MTIKLSKRDYRDIMDWATEYYKETQITDPQLHVCQCYLKAICSWSASRNYAIIDGNLVENENESQTSS